MNIFVIRLIILINLVAPQVFAQSNVGNVNSSAKSSSQQNDKAGSSNIVLGQALIAAGSAIPLGGGAFLIFMGVTALKQGEAQKRSAQGARRTAYDSSYSAIKYEDNIDWSKFNDSMNQGLDYLKKNGYKFDKDKLKVTTPGGKSFGMNQLTKNATDMAALTGMEKSDIEKALTEMDKQAKDAMKKNGLDKVSTVTTAVATVDSGGGGAGSGSGLGLSGLLGMNERLPTSENKLAGLKKFLGNDAIGIAQDDIFQMIQRRYREKEQAEFFSK